MKYKANGTKDMYEARSVERDTFKLVELTMRRHFHL